MPSPLGNLYPFTSHFLDRGGLKYHYLDEGSGDGVVMLHGNPSWSFYYRNLLNALKDNYRVIVPDHIGCGLSDKPGDDQYQYTLKSRVDDLDALLDHLQIKNQITLVVHDWGGMIGMALASRYPERIKRLVILNTSAFPLPASKPFPWALSICRNTRIGAFLVRGFNAFSFMAALIGCKQNPMSCAVQRAYRFPYDSWKNRIATLRFVQDIPLKPGDPAFDLINEVANGLHRFKAIPMFIGWGLKDFVFDQHFLEEWQKRFPGAEVHCYENSGHYILEDQQQALIPLIRQFLDAHPLQAITSNA